MASVQLDGIRKVHPGGGVALAGIDLDIADGELVVICGPSGSGKTTLLRVVAGLDPPTAGHVVLDGVRADKVPAGRRNVAMISQEHALLRHLDVEGNLAFPLKIRHTPEPELHDRVQAEARVLGLGRVLKRRPRELSAGQRQLTALGRVTVRPAGVYLMDEPLTHIDPTERARLRAEIRRVQQGMGVTTLYATNDQLDALMMADRVVVLRDGTVEQVASPDELLGRPANVFVAGFFGLPAMTFVEATVVDEGGLGWLDIGGQRLRMPGGLPGPLRDRAGRAVLVGARSHHLHDAEAVPEHPGDQRLRVTVTRVDRLGSEDLVHGAVGGAVLVARFDAHTGPPAGSTVELAVEVRWLQAFDPVSERALWHGRVIA